MGALTAKEQEILQLLWEYNGDRYAVQSRLNIARTTVCSHLDSIFEKLEVHNITSAMVQAIKLGIVDTGKRDLEMEKPEPVFVLPHLSAEQLAMYPTSRLSSALVLKMQGY